MLASGLYALAKVAAMIAYYACAYDMPPQVLTIASPDVWYIPQQATMYSVHMHAVAVYVDQRRLLCTILSLPLVGNCAHACGALEGCACKHLQRVGLLTASNMPHIHK
jgi:hypothetical protein